MNFKIKKEFRDKTLLTLTIRAGLFTALFVLLSSSVFANTIRYVHNAKMDKEQAHYYNVILNDEPTMGTNLFEINLEIFKSDKLTLNFPDGTNYQVDKQKTLVKFGSREAWYGKIVGGGEVHLVPNWDKQMLTGTVYLPHRTWAIRSLGKGLQVMIDYDASGLAECGTPRGEFNPSDESNPNLHTPHNKEVDGYEQSNTEVLNTDCFIRVIVAYTTPVATAEADPLALIMDAMSQSNAAYVNSGINQQLALALVYETPFDDTGMAQGDVLAAWRSTTDGNMDEVHSLRSSTYRACLLYTSPSPRDATLSRMPSSA